MRIFETPRPVVSIAGGDDVFPVHRIYCVGQNYGAHAREMGSDPERSRYFELAAGDLVFTGTPAGVGPVAPGDRLAGGIEGIDEIRIRFATG